MVGQGSPPRIQGTSVVGVGVAMHKPPQGPVLGQIWVGVHVEAGGHGPLMVHGWSDEGVAMHRPPVPVVSVGVQLDAGGQLGVVMVAGGVSRHGERGVGVAKQMPPQGVVWVQMEPAGQGSPLTTQEESGGGEGSAVLEG